MEKETYCLCGEPYTVGQFMIECDCCREWFHGSCVDVKIYQSEDIDKYHCPKCAQIYGPSILKMPTNSHRQDRYELGSESRPAQAGAPAWVAALAARPPRVSRAALQTYAPHEFNEQLVRDNGFTRPVLFNSPEGLGMTMPDAASFTPRTVMRYCGPNMEIEVIDVRKQNSLRMPLCELVAYIETPPAAREEKVLNVLSLEVSDTELTAFISPPALVRALDWAERVWPEVESVPARPAVQKYCLISAAGSYTDFHVDFGGTSVWYHALRGRKVFYLVPPTSTNLALYQQWNTSNNQSERFFGDLVEWYATVEVCAGQTLFIPTGWIHAVLTPVDSLVFGGNFLHSYAVELQLQINEIERRVDTPVVFRYPLFEAMHWCAGAHFLSILRRHNEEARDEDYTDGDVLPTPSRQQLPPLLVRGVRILTTALKEWHALKSVDPSKRDNVPKSINSAQLVRDLCRELRTLDRQRPAQRNVPQKTLPRTNNVRLTLPPPIVHGGEYIEADPQQLAYSAPVQDVKSYIDVRHAEPGYGYEEAYLPQDVSFVERHERKGGGSVLRIKLGSPDGRSVEPPSYSPEHSILKSQLTAAPQARHQLWTISRKDDDLLFTNDIQQAPAPHYPAHGVPNYATGYGGDAGEAQYAEQPMPTEYPAHINQIEYSHTLYPDKYEMIEEPQQAHYTTAPPPYDAHYVTYAPPVEPPAQAKPAQPLRRSERPARRRLSNSYSYEDGDLLIDETPPRRREKNKQTFRSPVGSFRQQRAAPVNGIESLIQASELAEQPADHTKSQAVAGMLSMGERGANASERTFGLPTQTSERRARRAPPPPRSDSESDEEVIREVHRDEEFVYPALEPSDSDSDDGAFHGGRRRHRNGNDARRDKDESWSPRARLGRLAPRQRGPARPGVRREAVRKALQAAAQTPPAPKPSPLPLAPRRVPPPQRRPPPPPPPAPKPTISRPKKGMKTAKQRLGKILKIHKMIY